MKYSALQCVICLDEIQTCYSCMTCKKHFCVGCLERWIEIAHSCPHCRISTENIKNYYSLLNNSKSFLKVEVLSHLGKRIITQCNEKIESNFMEMENLRALYDRFLIEIELDFLEKKSQLKTWHEMQVEDLISETETVRIGKMKVLQAIIDQLRKIK